jgi:FemAB-related protein (PEP-CTERM system-associated)
MSTPRSAAANGLAVTVHRSPPANWDDYVAAQPAACVYQLAGWPTAVASIFGLEAFYLTAGSGTGPLRGILPLIRQKGWLMGNRLTSLPFFNYGGALADNEATRATLMDEAVELARRLGKDRVEFRDMVAPPPGWSHRADKATLLLDLPSSHEALQKQFGSKLRSQIKRAERELFEVKIGGRDRIDDFYPVFAEVMRDLGTPVYPRRFFEQLAERMAEFCTVLTIHREERPVSGAFLVGWRNTLEIPWAATISAEKPRATNMLLYSEVLKLAVARGYSVFDFGRSTIDSGPYRFKLQWGARPVPLHWSVWPPEMFGGNQGHGTSLRDRATRAWSKLPLSVANRLGPLISPSLPW